MIAGGHPLPTDNGAKRRILATADFLSRRHDLTLVSLREAGSPKATIAAPRWRDLPIDHSAPGRAWTAARALLSRRSYVQLKYSSAELSTVVQRLLATESFDCVWVHMLGMAHAVEHLFREPRAPSARPLLVLDQHNLDEHYFRSFAASGASAPLRAFGVLEAMKARGLQRRWYPRFDMILCVAPEDVSETARFVDRSRARVLLAPNGVDLEYFEPVAPEALRARARVVVFGGSLDVTMNVDAVRWFAGSILPQIRRRAPDVHFLIVGRNPPRDLLRVDCCEGTTLTGTVADVREHYREAAVFAVPLRIGGGTKLKTLEAMAMALPVVSTRVGAQGLEVAAGRHLHVADDPREFAERVVQLLEDRDAAVALGAEARRLVESRYGWSAILGGIEGVLQGLLVERGGAPRAVQAVGRR
jgi:glycosyltransferase involved in cell wall biosynthesis